MTTTEQLARKRQVAWDNFIKKRTQTEAQYSEMIRVESNSPYEPMRQFVSTLPKTLAEIVPSFYLPMETQLEYPEKVGEEISKYNTIVAQVNSITEQMLIKAEEEAAKFAEEVPI